MDQGNVQNLIRFKDWRSNKLTNLLIIIYLYLFWLEEPFYRDRMVYCVLFMISAFGFAAFGYLVNDWADKEQDKLAGKKNHIGKVSSLTGVLLIVAFWLVGILPWIWLPSHILMVGLLILETALLLMYSLPPIRLKERGVFGVLADASYAHVIPAALIIFMFGGFVHSWWLAISILVWQAAMGCRNILIHQLQDLKKDELSGISTFIGKVGFSGGKSFVLYVLLPLELIAVGITLFLLAGANIWAYAILAAFLLVKAVVVNHFYLMHADEDRHLRYTKSIINNTYDEWLPLVLLTWLAVFIDVKYAFLLIAHILVFNQNTLSLLLWRVRDKFGKK